MDTENNSISTLPNRTKLNNQLLHAAEHGDPAAIPALIAAGADINATNSQGWTALMLAALRGDPRMVTNLLDVAGVDITIQNQEGDTAISIAHESKIRDREIVNLFAERYGAALRPYLTRVPLFLVKKRPFEPPFARVKFPDGSEQCFENFINNLQNPPKPVVFSCKKIDKSARNAPIATTKQMAGLSCRPKTEKESAENSRKKSRPE